MTYKPFRVLGLCAALIGLTPPAFAHGDAAHANPHAAQPAEQTPWGIAGTPGRPARTIAIRMTDDMRFTPDKLSIKPDETIRFLITNNGKRLHEMVLGTPGALAEHAALMKKYPKMEHAEAHMSHVAAGQSGKILWQFNRTGSFEFACLVGQHYEKGMRGTIEVRP